MAPRLDRLWLDPDTGLPMPDEIRVKTKS